MEIELDEFCVEFPSSADVEFMRVPTIVADSTGTIPAT